MNIFVKFQSENHQKTIKQIYTDLEALALNPAVEKLIKSKIFDLVVAGIKSDSGNKIVEELFYEKEKNEKDRGGLMSFAKGLFSNNDKNNDKWLSVDGQETVANEINQSSFIAINIEHYKLKGNPTDWRVSSWDVAKTSLNDLFKSPFIKTNEQAKEYLTKVQTNLVSLFEAKAAYSDQATEPEDQYEEDEEEETEEEVIGFPKNQGEQNTNSGSISNQLTYFLEDFNEEGVIFNSEKSDDETSQISESMSHISDDVFIGEYEEYEEHEAPQNQREHDNPKSQHGSLWDIAKMSWDFLYNSNNNTSFEQTSELVNQQEKDDDDERSQDARFNEILDTIKTKNEESEEYLIEESGDERSQTSKSNPDISEVIDKEKEVTITDRIKNSSVLFSSELSKKSESMFDVVDNINEGTKTEGQQFAFLENQNEQSISSGLIISDQTTQVEQQQPNFSPSFSGNFIKENSKHETIQTSKNNLDIPEVIDEKKEANEKQKGTITDRIKSSSVLFSSELMKKFTYSLKEDVILPQGEDQALINETKQIKVELNQHVKQLFDLASDTDNPEQVNSYIETQINPFIERLNTPFYYIDHSKPVCWDTLNCVLLATVLLAVVATLFLAFSCMGSSAAINMGAFVGMKLKQLLSSFAPIANFAMSLDPLRLTQDIAANIALIGLFGAAPYLPTFRGEARDAAKDSVTFNKQAEKMESAVNLVRENRIEKSIDSDTSEILYTVTPR